MGTQQDGDRAVPLQGPGGSEDEQQRGCGAILSLTRWHKAMKPAIQRPLPAAALSGAPRSRAHLSCLPTLCKHSPPPTWRGATPAGLPGGQTAWFETAPAPT